MDAQRNAKVFLCVHCANLCDLSVWNSTYMSIQVEFEHDLLPFVSKNTNRKSMLLPACLESAAGLVESGLHSHHAELAVFSLAMRGHHPHKIDRMTWH